MAYTGVGFRRLGSAVLPDRARRWSPATCATDCQLDDRYLQRNEEERNVTGPREGQPPPPEIWRYHATRRQVDRSHVPAGLTRGPGGSPAGEYGNYTLRDFLTVLFKQKRIITTFFVAAMATVVIGLILKRPTYEATAAILVKRTRAEVPLTPTRTDAIVMQLSVEDLNSEVEILRSRSLVEAALAKLGAPPGESPGLLARAKGSIKRALGMPVLSDFEQQVIGLEQRLSFSLIPRSNVIEIGFRSRSPDRAAEVVSALVDEYLTYRVDVHRAKQAASFFDAQTETAERELAEAETALEEYTQAARVSMSHEEQMDLALRKLDQFERAVAEAYVEVQRDENRVAALEERLSGVPERLPTAYRLNQDPETEQLRANLVELRLERDDLLTRYSPTNVFVRELDARIEQAEERLREVEQRVGDINRTELNEVHQELKSQLLTAQAELAGTRARYYALRVQVEAFQAELDNLNEKSFDLTRLIREATAAEQAYLLYRQKRDEVHVSQAMDQQNMVNVSIAREPRRPLTPVGFSKLGLLASALVLVSIGSVAVGFARDFFDHSFTTGEQLEQRLDIPHLASIPRLREVHGVGTELALVGHRG